MVHFKKIHFGVNYMETKIFILLLILLFEKLVFNQVVLFLCYE